MFGSSSCLAAGSEEPKSVFDSQMVLQLANFAVFWTKANGGKWIKLSQGKLPDQKCQDNRGLADCLASCGYVINDAPAHIVAAAKERIPAAGTVTPAHIRTAIRKTSLFQQGLKSGSIEQRLQVKVIALKITSSVCFNRDKVSETGC